MTKHWNRV